MRLLAHAHDQCFVCFDQRKTTLIFWLQNRVFLPSGHSITTPTAAKNTKGRGLSTYTLTPFLSRIYLLEWEKIDNRTTPLTTSTW